MAEHPHLQAVPGSGAPATGWPTPIPWDTPGPGDTPAAGKQRHWPPVDWPTTAQLDYTQKLITVVLLVLALPWLVGKLVTRPGDVLAAAGHKHVGTP
jgi:hypothetical protein